MVASAPSASTSSASAAAAPAGSRPPSFVRGLALALGTLALSTWALGSLWLAADAAGRAPTATTARAE